jgi:hypothetical protein
MAVTFGRAFPERSQLPANGPAAKGRDVLGGFVANGRDMS